MTPAGIEHLASRARDEHMALLGLRPTPWHLAPQPVRTAWLATVALVLSETKRESANAAADE